MSIIVEKKYTLLDFSSNLSLNTSSASLGLLNIVSESSLVEDRKYIAGKLKLYQKNITFPTQVHSDKVKIVNEPGNAGQYDGLITTNHNIIISIQVADCVPIFLYSPDVDAIGLVHAGWRGTAMGIVANAINRMINDLCADTKKIKVFLGPSIKKCCYTVNKNVALRFPFEVVQHNNNNYKLDLHLTNEMQLIKAGVDPANIEKADYCTYCDDIRFHSYRRDGKKAGRNFCFLSFT